MSQDQMIIADSNTIVVAAEQFGAIKQGRRQTFRIYVPDRNRDDEKLGDHAIWVTRAMDILTFTNGGATATGYNLGYWHDKQRDKTIKERTKIVYSYIIPERFKQYLSAVVMFLHDFKESTNQEVVYFEFDGVFFGIDDSCERPKVSVPLHMP